MTRPVSIHIQALQQELKALGEAVPETESLEALLTESEAVVDRIDELARRNDKHWKRKSRHWSRGWKLHSLNSRMQASELETWKGQWQEVVGRTWGLGLMHCLQRSTDILENIRSLFEQAERGGKTADPHRGYRHGCRGIS